MMSTKYIFIAAALLSATSVVAQVTYENANLITEDLNGTARYVGMGGAMEALGADISTISSNPAGIGLFRHSTANISGGLITQSGAPSFAKGDKTNASLDQIGFVYSMKTNRNSYLNFGFNYHKSKNFDYILAAAGNLGGKASQNALSYIKGIIDVKDEATGGMYSDLNVEKVNNVLMGRDYYTSQLDNLYYNNFIFDADGNHGYNFADGYIMNREQSGYIGSYDFNISGNIKNKVFLGITFGVKDVNYKAFGEYTEDLINADGMSIGSTTVRDSRNIEGTGFDVKAGIIFRPIDNSPFRIGLYVHTPTWYDLTTENYTTLANGTNIAGYKNGWGTREAYDFKLYTPWKFGLSLGHTVGRNLALGATYEYADYSNIDTRVNDGGYYDWWYDEYYSTSSSDDVMNDHTEKTLKGVSTLKLGLEYKPIDNFAVRMGYNYVSPMYKSDGYKDVSLDSYGTNYSTTTDYTNWKSTNRFTLGLGYTIDKFTIDFAYQYSAQKGDFHPFMDSYADYTHIDGSVENIDNYADKVEVKNNRNQFLLTLGYHF